MNLHLIYSYLWNPAVGLWCMNTFQQGPLLLAWIDFNPYRDKVDHGMKLPTHSQTLTSAVWELINNFIYVLWWISLLVYAGTKLINVSKRGPKTHFMLQAPHNTCINLTNAHVVRFILSVCYWLDVDFFTYRFALLYCTNVFSRFIRTKYTIRCRPNMRFLIIFFYLEWYIYIYIYIYI